MAELGQKQVGDVGDCISEEMKRKFLKFFGWFMVGCVGLCLAIL